MLKLSRALYWISNNKASGIIETSTVKNSRKLNSAITRGKAGRGGVGLLETGQFYSCVTTGGMNYKTCNIKLHHEKRQPITQREEK